METKLDLKVITVDDQYMINEINSDVTINIYINLVENGYNIACSIYKKAIIEMFRQ